MGVVIDTTVWSLALRRQRTVLPSLQQAVVRAWEELVRRREAVLLGLVRQELLSGIREPAQYERLRTHLRAWNDETILVEDHEEAARCANTCRAAGVAGSTVDYLICAVAIRRDMPVFTLDEDFSRYAKHLPLQRYEVVA